MLLLLKIDVFINNVLVEYVDRMGIVVIFLRDTYSV